MKLLLVKLLLTVVKGDLATSWRQIKPRGIAGDPKESRYHKMYVEWLNSANLTFGPGEVELPFHFGAINNPL